MYKNSVFTMSLMTKKFLDEQGLLKLLTLIKSTYYTTKEVDELLKKINVGGDNGSSYDDTELKQWIKTNFLEKSEINIDEYEKTSDLLIKLTDIKSEFKEDIQDMATQSYVDEEDKKLIEELNKKCNVEICDTQYEFDNILTKDNNTIYLIKGDQDVWAAKDYVDDLWDVVVELRNRLNTIEGVNSDETITEEPSVR